MATKPRNAELIANVITAQSMRKSFIFRYLLNKCNCVLKLNPRVDMANRGEEPRLDAPNRGAVNRGKKITSFAYF